MARRGTRPVAPERRRRAAAAATPTAAKPAAAARRSAKGETERRFGDDLDYACSDSAESSDDSPEAGLSDTDNAGWTFTVEDAVAPGEEEEEEDDEDEEEEEGDEDAHLIGVYYLSRQPRLGIEDVDYARAVTASMDDKPRSCRKRAFTDVEKDLLKVRKGWKPPALSSQDAKCLGCFTDEKVITALPCRHACYCEGCFSNKSNDSKICPFCRHRVGVWISTQQLSELKPIY